MAEIILPGTYVTVRDEALISAGRVVTGNIGITGTAAKGPVNEFQILGSFSEAKEIFGNSDPWIDGNNNELTLIRALEHIYNNGGRTVYAIRTAKATASKAAYQTKDTSDANLSKLEAQTPGTWGNEIRIIISDADDPAFVIEKLAGDATNLNRSNIVADSGLNSIIVKQKSTGLTLRYDIVYNTDPDNAKTEVGINTTTGVLKFTTLAGFEPTGDDVIVANYEVPDANSKKVELTYQAIKETYNAADASHLAELVNQKSVLVSSAESDESNFYNKIPKNTDGEKLFGTGLDGHTAGSNGEAAGPDEYKSSLAQLENEIINIVVLAGQDVSSAQMVTALAGHLNTTSEIKRERIGIMGSNGSDDVNNIAGHTLNSDRLIFVDDVLKFIPRQ